MFLNHPFLEARARCNVEKHARMSILAHFSEQNGE